MNTEVLKNIILSVPEIEPSDFYVTLEPHEALLKEYQSNIDMFEDDELTIPILDLNFLNWFLRDRVNNRLFWAANSRLQGARNRVVLLSPTINVDQLI